MIKKITAFTFSVALTTSLFSPTFASANSNKDITLTYDRIINKLETIQKNVQQDMNLTLSEKESISKENHELVSKYLEKNRNMSIDKQIELTDTLVDIENILYDVQSEKGNIDFGSNSENFVSSSVENKSAPIAISPTAAAWTGKGDILISLKAKTSGLPHGHAAILSTDAHKVIEALPSPGVVHHSASKYWSTVNDEGQYYVKGAPSSAYTKAVSYAKSQIGEPYKLKTSLSNTSEWYCSKLVYKAWQNAGYHVGTLDAYAGAVLPISIKTDFDTVHYKSNPY